MNSYKFIITTLIFLIFALGQPAFAMNEQTHSNFSLSGLKSFMTLPKVLTTFSLVALSGYVYKTRNWKTFIVGLGTTFILYRLLDYQENMAWRNELHYLLAASDFKNTDLTNLDNLNQIVRATELLKKINDRKLNDEMSFSWTHNVFKKIIKNIITFKNILDIEKKIIGDLLDLFSKNNLVTDVNKIYEYINNYQSYSEQGKEVINKEIEALDINIDTELPYY